MSDAAKTAARGYEELNMKAYQRLLNYVTFDTTSDEASEVIPSTESQSAFAAKLADEMTAIGLTNVRIEHDSYVYGTVPATPGYENAVAIGFIAHMDTAPDFCGKSVTPRIVENYDGGVLPLGDSGRSLDPKVLPHLPTLAGRTLIVTDGRTLLGADDKAGIAEILTAAETLLTDSVPHGPVQVAFTPDEEIGRGASAFNVKDFGADFAYTVDGGEEGTLSYENFNAAYARVDFSGVNVHPGSAKDVMVNASLAAMAFNAMLPSDEIPARTDGYEGFYHLTDMRGNVESAELHYIIRDHDADKFENRLSVLRTLTEKINGLYGENTAKLTVRYQYRNMLEKVLPHRHIIDNAVRACEMAGVPCRIEATRGGTDGATLSYMGLVCPNLGTGGYAFHGPYEHITVEGMDAETQIILNIIRLYSETANR